MTMKKANVEFVEFDAKDVITTSGKPIITPSDVTGLIWMSNQSVNFYNDMYDKDWTLGTAVDEQGNKYAYYGYLSDGTRDYDTSVLSASKMTNDIALVKNEVIMPEGDADYYLAILNWLNLPKITK